uniref:Uncharacterized protein n=1 Tax=Solanum lycopersicum TaxID=4081 RepID=A0A3Q7HCE3_SOLLC
MQPLQFSIVNDLPLLRIGGRVLSLFDLLGPPLLPFEALTVQEQWNGLMLESRYRELKLATHWTQYSLHVTSLMAILLPQELDSYGYTRLNDILMPKDS